MTDLMSVGLPYLGELFLLLSVWYTFLSSFPSSASTYLLDQFSQYGTILKHEVSCSVWICDLCVSGCGVGGGGR